MLRGTWPGKLVKQYGRFQLHTSMFLTARGVVTSDSRYKLLLENAPDEPIALSSIEDAHSDLASLLQHVQQWQRAQRIYIERMEAHIATLEKDEQGQRQKQQAHLDFLKTRYEIVEQALAELETLQQSS